LAIRVLGLGSLVLLPLSFLLWYTSYTKPVQGRIDLTLYYSLNVYLVDGVCGLHILSMPTRAGVRGGFRAPLRLNPTPGGRSLLLSTKKSGPFRTTWVAFPLWLSTALLVLFCLLPVIQGPLRRRYRRRMGSCMYCGYDLTGNTSGRCPECGCAAESVAARAGAVIR